MLEPARSFFPICALDDARECIASRVLEFTRAARSPGVAARLASLRARKWVRVSALIKLSSFIRLNEEEGGGGQQKLSRVR